METVEGKGCCATDTQTSWLPGRLQRDTVSPSPLMEYGMSALLRRKCRGILLSENETSPMVRWLRALPVSSEDCSMTGQVVSSSSLSQLYKRINSSLTNTSCKTPLWNPDIQQTSTPSRCLYLEVLFLSERQPHIRLKNQ